jgi:ADP-ribose pyrophosphatase
MDGHAMPEPTLKSETVFAGRLLRVERLDVALDSGRRSVREVVRHPGAVVILPRLPDGRWVLVRQFRKAIERELLEAVAGTLEPGEDPAACAVRELAEETGYAAGALHKLGSMFPAPGYTDECLHVFQTDVAGPAAGHRPEEDERIEIVRVTPAELTALIRDGRIEDAKALAAWAMWTAGAAKPEGTP